MVPATAKRQWWSYEPILDDTSKSPYWEAPLGHSLVAAALTTVSDITATQLEDTTMEQDTAGDNTSMAALTTAALSTATRSYDSSKEQDTVGDSTPIAVCDEDDDGENMPIAALLLRSRKETSRARRQRKDKRQLWEYQPAVDNASKYWDVEIEGKRSRRSLKASYCEDDAQSESDNDSEEEFKLQREDAASSESDDEPSSKKKVTPSPQPPNSAGRKYYLTLPSLAQKVGKELDANANVDLAQIGRKKVRPFCHYLLAHVLHLRHNVATCCTSFGH